MLSLYEILKASKIGIAPDMWTALAGKNWGGADSGHEVKELTGIPPLSIRSNGTMLLDYLISGNMSQTSTPTSTNPIQPQGTGERTANVMPAGEQKTVVSNGVTFSSDGNGRYHISGTATADALARFNLLSAFTTPISVSNGGQGTLSFFNTSVDINVTFTFYNGTTMVDDWKQTPIRRTSTAYNAIGNKYVDNVVIEVKSGATVEITITPEFTNNGVLPASFEPYGYKIPVSSANTTTPVYLGEVQTTRKIKKLVLDGTETWSLWASGQPDVERYYYKWGKVTPSDYGLICTHFPFIQGDGNIEHIRLGGSNRDDLAIFISKTIASTLADFKAFLAQQYAAGTPVCVWYVLAESTTGIVNEPLRKIGDYADTLSMEQAGVQIPTNRGNTVIDVLTELKPSEMYVKYQE